MYFCITIILVNPKNGTCCSWKTAADVACSMLVVIAFWEQRLTPIQGLPRPLNAAASMHTWAAHTLTDVYLTLMPHEP